MIASPEWRETGFLDRSLEPEGETHRYQLFRPRGAPPPRGWPLILFLHGAGERGEDGLLQTEVGLGAALRRQVSRFPCLALFPQVASERCWSEPAMAERAISCLHETCRSEPVDPRRLYLTGLSMGGTGVWYLATHFPDTFAALAPVCGGIGFPAAACGDPDSAANRRIYRIYAEAIGATPVWAFHGADDPVIDPGFTRGVVAALASRGYHPRHTEYPGCGHNSWDLAYAEATLWEWLFEQDRG